MNVQGSVVIVNTRRNKAPEIITQKVFYLANFDMRNDTLNMKTITENFSTSRNGFQTPQELKRVVTDMTAQQKNIYDDLYSLSYKKIPKPQPVKPL